MILLVLKVSHFLSQSGHYFDASTAVWGKLGNYIFPCEAAKLTSFLYIIDNCIRDMRVQLFSWFQCFLLPKFMRFLLFSAQNWHFYFDFALFFSVLVIFRVFVCGLSHPCNMCYSGIHMEISKGKVEWKMEGGKTCNVGSLWFLYYLFCYSFFPWQTKNNFI